MPSEPSQLAAALAKVQAELKPIPRNAEGQAGNRKIKYADLATMETAVFPLLGKNGLAFICRLTRIDGQFVMAYSLLHESGEREDGIFPMPDRATPQQLGGHITYARRYALGALTGAVAEGEDDDAAGATEVTMDRGIKTAWTDPEHVRLTKPSPDERVNGREAERGPVNVTEFPELASPGQIRAIWTVLGTVFKFSNDEKDAARAVCAHIIGHPLASTKDMTWAEAKKVLDDLSEWQELAKESRMTPREFLTLQMVGVAATAEQDAAEDAQEPVDAP